MTKCTVQEILDAFEEYTIEVTNETHECFVLDGKSKMRVSHLTVFIAVSEASQRHVTFVTDVGTHWETKLLQVYKTQHQTGFTQNTKHNPTMVPWHLQDSGYSVWEQRKAPKKQCCFCSYMHIPRLDKCSAYSKSCRMCHEKNHFELQCPNKEMRTHKQKTVDHRKKYKKDASITCALFQHPPLRKWKEIHNGWRQIKNSKMPNALWYWTKKEVTFQIDTGATINILPAKCAREIKPYNGVLLMWNKTLMRSLGVCRRTIKNHKPH